MALTSSRMLPLGTMAPAFSLPSTSGELVSLKSAKGEFGTIVMFICNHCPYVKHLKSYLGEFGRECINLGVAVIAINSNDAEAYSEDSLPKMTIDKEKFGYPFPYLFDNTQKVAKAYDAACTPDFYLFDRDLKLAYRGQFDSSRPGNELPVTGEDLRNAVQLVIQGKAVPEPHIPSIGCNIKWKA